MIRGKHTVIFIVVETLYVVTLHTNQGGHTRTDLRERSVMACRIACALQHGKHKVSTMGSLGGNS